MRRSYKQLDIVLVKQVFLAFLHLSYHFVTAKWLTPLRNRRLISLPNSRNIYSLRLVFRLYKSKDVPPMCITEVRSICNNWRQLPLIGSMDSNEGVPLNCVLTELYQSPCRTIRLSLCRLSLTAYSSCSRSVPACALATSYINVKE